MSDQAWAALLDRFERDLDDATAEFTPWSPPTTPLPVALTERAGALLRRQHEQIARTREQLDDVRDHLDALSRVPATRTDAPAYLDVDG